MSERKYTDEEIINKMSAYIEMSCRMCAFKTLCNDLCAIEFIKAALKAALGLIKSQKAEIEKLQEVNADLNESLRLAAEANKDMKIELDAMRGAANSLKIHYENARAEAIREFAERLKEESGCIVARRDGVELYTTKLYQIRATDIDNLVAEMTEGK